MHVEGILARKGREVATIAPGASLLEAVALLKEHGVGALVVSSDGARIDGILSERDVVRRVASDGPDALEMTAARAMTSEVSTCGVGDDLEHLMRLMTERRFRHLPVVDESQRLCGIISIGDVVKHRLGELELENQQLFDYIANPR